MIDNMNIDTYRVRHVYMRGVPEPFVVDKVQAQDGTERHDNSVSSFRLEPYFDGQPGFRIKTQDGPWVREIVGLLSEVIAVGYGEYDERGDLM